MVNVRLGLLQCLDWSSCGGFLQQRAISNLPARWGERNSKPGPRRCCADLQRGQLWKHSCWPHLYSQGDTWGRKGDIVEAFVWASHVKVIIRVWKGIVGKQSRPHYLRPSPGLMWYLPLSLYPLANQSLHDGWIANRRHSSPSSSVSQPAQSTTPSHLVPDTNACVVISPWESFTVFLCNSGGLVLQPNTYSILPFVLHCVIYVEHCTYFIWKVVMNLPYTVEISMTKC